MRWLRSPAARWVRLPLGILFILGSLLFILPIFGLWMLPVGLLLLAEDVPALRRMRTRVLNWIERHRPHWFSEHHEQIKDRRRQHEEFRGSREGFRGRVQAQPGSAVPALPRAATGCSGLWAAGRLGIAAGDEAEAYARAVVDADFEKPGDSDVIEKVRNDLAAKGIEMSEAQLRTELTRATDEAKRQLSQGIPGLIAQGWSLGGARAVFCPRMRLTASAC